jgi:hypothetical protein
MRLTLALLALWAASLPALAEAIDAPPAGGVTFELPASAVAVTPPSGSASAPSPAAATRVAQFELPSETTTGVKPVPPPSRLTWQYSYGVESPITWRRDRDLDTRLRDDFGNAKPKITGLVVWRPINWLSTTLEAKLGHEFVLHEEDPTVLPNGDLVAAQQRQPTLVVEQAFINVRGITAPFEFNLGRRNYEDERHFLYDGSIDVASVSLRHENFRAEAFVGRDVLWSLDLLQKAKKVPVETVMLHGDYRGFENQTIGFYVMKRRDLSGQEGSPVTFGLRASGRPTTQWSYWSEFALQRGTDENGRPFGGRAFDVGTTYRFAELPHDPNITLAYAYGSGDAGGDRNTGFRQTGLHSNEAKYIGLAKFKTYGEMLDPELSNLKIATLGIGARATPGISIDLVYHRYWLDRIATDGRNWGLTAPMNPAGVPPSTDVGQEIDLVVGFRGLFGVRRLGLDLRLGKFFPGHAFRTANGGDPAMLRRADNGAIVVAKFRW